MFVNHTLLGFSALPSRITGEIVYIFYIVYIVYIFYSILHNIVCIFSSVVRYRYVTSLIPAVSLSCLPFSTHLLLPLLFKVLGLHLTWCCYTVLLCLFYEGWWSHVVYVNFVSVFGLRKFFVLLRESIRHGLRTCLMIAKIAAVLIFLSAMRRYIVEDI